MADTNNSEEKQTAPENAVSSTSPPESLPQQVIRVENHSARYWEILQHNIEWLRFSETKAALILTVYGIIFTMGYTNSTAIFTSMKGSGLVISLIFLYGLLSLISIGFAFACINPNLKNKNLDSIIYFGHISKKFKKFSDYKTHAKVILDDEEKFTDQISEQIHFVSGIAWKKFVKVTWSLRIFIVSLIIMVLTIFSYLVTVLK